MSYELISNTGTVEAVIDDNCGIKKFYSIANTLSKDMKAKFLEKKDDVQYVEWDFKYKGHHLKLNYSMYNGVSISPTQPKDNKAVKELATLLESKYF